MEQINTLSEMLHRYLKTIITLSSQVHRLDTGACSSNKIRRVSLMCTGSERKLCIYTFSQSVKNAARPIAISVVNISGIR